MQAPRLFYITLGFSSHAFAPCPFLHPAAVCTRLVDRGFGGNGPSPDDLRDKQRASTALLGELGRLRKPAAAMQDGEQKVDKRLFMARISAIERELVEVYGFDSGDENAQQ